ncbi:hypothetical protein CPB86DRAFT_829638 [Serendipita vermifera]|nr:hypothetical protein CPB86DRAFT_829638 [Serendipita vermifera]
MRLRSSFTSLLALALLATSKPVISAESFSPWPPRPKANLTQCIKDILNHTLAYEPFLVAPNGSRTFNTTEAIGTDYATCKEYCGTSATPFQWSLFSPQFTGWLLPFLALTAQLPYESDGTWHDLMSLFLTIGSPQLAMYSLALTILNSRYAKRRLDDIFSQHPHPQRQLMLNDLKKKIFQTLRFSQQQPFEFGELRPHPPTLDDTRKTADELLWWTAVQETLARRERWFTASLATQAAWAIIAFSFTWVDAFGSEKIGTNITAFGLAIALCWSWILVLVLGWFFAGVSISHCPMSEAIERANRSHPDTIKRLAVYERRRGFAYSSLSRRIPGDAERAGPLYNYAKVFVWSHIVDHVIDAIQRNILNSPSITVQSLPPTPNVGENLEMRPILSHSPVSPSRDQYLSPPPTITVVSPSLLAEGPEPGRYLWEDERNAFWKRAVYSRIFWASMSATLLNIATVGSAFWLDFLTPTVGLGCRSGGVLVYWMSSYIIWIILVFSAWISDRWSVHEATQRFNRQEPGRYALGTLAVALRLLGKTLAILNSAWIIMHSMFEFTRFYNRCYCQTNRMTGAWIFLDDAQIRNLDNVRERWLGLALLTGTVCAGYISFIGFWTLRRL